MFRDFGLLNRLPALILVYFVSVLPFTVWMLRGFVAAIPVELEDAAQVDGCSRLGAFLRVVLPLLGPGLVATSIYGFITAWNQFLYARSCSRCQCGSPHSVRRSGLGRHDGGVDDVRDPGAGILAIVQRRTVSGLASGAVKG